MRKRESKSLCSKPSEFLLEFNVFLKSKPALKSPHQGVNVALRTQPKAESKSHYFHNHV